MNIIAVEYVYDPAQSATIDEVRPVHREFLASLLEQEVLVASGPFVDMETPGALLLLRAESPEAALSVLEADPFADAGVIAERSARAWNPVIGPWG